MLNRCGKTLQKSEKNDLCSEAFLLIYLVRPKQYHLINCLGCVYLLFLAFSFTLWCFIARPDNRTETASQPASHLPAIAQICHKKFGVMKTVSDHKLHDEKRSHREKASVYSTESLKQE
jgi:hypothetical protein